MRSGWHHCAFWTVILVIAVVAVPWLPHLPTTLVVAKGAGHANVKLNFEAAPAEDATRRYLLFRHRELASLLANPSHPEFRWKSAPTNSSSTVDEQVMFAFDGWQTLGGYRVNRSFYRDTVVVEYHLPDDSVRDRAIPIQFNNDPVAAIVTVPASPPESGR